MPQIGPLVPMNVSRRFGKFNEEFAIVEKRSVSERDVTETHGGKSFGIEYSFSGDANSMKQSCAARILHKINDGEGRRSGGVFRFHVRQIASAGPRRRESPELVSARIKHAFRDSDTVEWRAVRLFEM